MVWRGILALIAALTAVPAQAEWLEARSKHFTLYSNTAESILRRQAESLERLDWGLRRFMKIADEAEVESRKVTVFLVPKDDIRRLCRCTNVSGFYHSNVSGSLAFSGKGGWTDEESWGRTVLFHEYAHHFMLGTYEIAFPAWYVEGFAEFASTMKLAKDSALIGVAANHRANGLFNASKLSPEQMFDPTLRGRLKTVEQIDAFYGRGWLLTHYLSFDAARFKQFKDYLIAINRGTPGAEAARQAFGDLKAFDRAVEKYLRASKIPGLTMRYGDSVPPPVTIRMLTPGEAALIRLRMDSVRGVDDAEAGKLYAKAAPLAARHPDDPVAQGWLAEMAFDAKDYKAAEAAAARALARDPKSVQALLYRGRVKLQLLEDAKSTDAAAWAEARRAVVAANRADPDDAEPLWWFWNSFAMEGKAPTPSAYQGLYRAQELAPQDDGVRFTAATVRIGKGETDEAKRLLRPLAYDPHAETDNPAARMLAALDAGKKGAEVLAAGAAVEPVAIVVEKKAGE